MSYRASSSYAFSQSEKIEEVLENTEKFEIDDEPFKIIRLHSDSYYKNKANNDENY